MDPPIPIILITGHGTAETAITAMSGGAFDYITKPFEPEKRLSPERFTSTAAEIAAVGFLAADFRWWRLTRLGLAKLTTGEWLWCLRHRFRACDQPLGKSQFVPVTNPKHRDAVFAGAQNLRKSDLLHPSLLTAQASAKRLM
ncbi:MAG: response regulator [Planctomycetota bacterium]